MMYQDIKNTLLSLSDPVMRLEFVMDLGTRLNAVPDSAQCTQIMGCASFVEICRDGNNFYGRADSALVRGIVAIFVAMVDGKTPDEIRQIDMESEFAGLDLNLGAGRLNAVNSMIRFFQNL
jgi:cysteine desulfuration protein SufE